MLRAFVAVEIPAELQDTIAKCTISLQKELPNPVVRWIPPRKLHLTIKFLGNITSDTLEQLAEGLVVEVASHEAFSMALAGLGSFPNSIQARVIWIGIKAPPNLSGLQREVESISAGLGFPQTASSFSPHLTIGRVGKNISPVDMQKIHSTLGKVTIGILGKIKVNNIYIYKSVLQPSGPVYNRLYTFPLRNPL
jgi:2'-5' RNA ligase